MEKISFLNPEFFWLFLLIPLAIAWLWWKNKQQTATLKLSSIKGFKGSKSILARLKPHLSGFRILSLCFLIIALARPRTVDVKEVDGIDIVLSIDISTSMLATDLKPDRLQALKKVASNFVEKRENDRIGLVIYAGEAYTRIPITSDKEIVQNALKRITIDGLINDGTAIGMGLATAINCVKDSKSKSKIIILLTDGENNSGFVEPETAADIAKEYGIKVYTIGIGTNGMANFPVSISEFGDVIYKPLPVKINENLLRSIANTTKGKYFRAHNNQKFEEIYEEINKLETSKIEDNSPFNYIEQFRVFAIISLILLVIEFILKNTIFKSII